ncbi:MAG: hypothetical protein V8R01_01735 [Bacilli bacterium]
MYDMTKLIPRYFKIKLKNNKVLEVEPPKLKILKKIMKLGSIKDNMEEKDFDNMILATSLALSKNKQNYKVSTDWLNENHDIDELYDLLTNYFNWVNEIQNSKN